MCDGFKRIFYFNGWIADWLDGFARQVIRSTYTPKASRGYSRQGGNSLFLSLCGQ